MPLKIHRPTRLELSIGGYPGPFYSVQWNGQSLQYRGTDDEIIEVAITPHGRTWSAFWRTMETVRVWNWRKRYVDLDILDGTSWEVLIQHDGKLIKSSGSNGYPGERESDQKRGISPRAFPQFCAAVRHLTRRPFA